MGWWDGYQWSQLPATPGYVDPYEPVGVLGRASQGLLGTLVGLKVVSILLDIKLYGDADRILQGQTFREFVGGAGAAALVSLAASVMSIVTAIVFLIWRYRVQKNLRGPLGVVGLDFTPGWSVGWWFVPIANFWKPKQAMNEAWLASDPQQPAGTRGWAGRKVDPLLSWWWGCWMLSFVVTFRVDSNAFETTTGELRVRLVQEMLGLGLSALAAYLGLRVVGEITARHLARARVLGIPEA